MAFVINDRVKETTTSIGTGTVNLGGAQTGFQGFVAGIGNANSTYYTIVGGSEWEVGIGTVTDAATDTLSRDSVISSSNSNNLVNFSAGTKDVFCTLPAKWTPSPVMNAQTFVNTHSTTITNVQTMESGVLAGPVSVTGTLTVTGYLIVI